MTEAQIAELERLDRAAQPGPWEARACSVVTPRAGFDMDGLPRPEEADLIAAARNALPRLLEERGRLLEALKSATEAIIGEWGSAEDLEAAIAFAEAPAL